MAAKKNTGLMAIISAGIMLQAGIARATCSLGGAAIAFGSYDALNPLPFDTIGSMVFQCNQRDHNVMITLGRGTGSAYATRYMVNGSQQLSYNLYRDTGRTIIWGDGSGGSQAYILKNPQPNNRDIIVPIFGRIPPGQNAKVGTYTDTITVTLTY